MSKKKMILHGMRMKELFDEYAAKNPYDKKNELPYYQGLSKFINDANEEEHRRRDLKKK